jgi:hypothetical protein
MKSLRSCFKKSTILFFNHIESTFISTIQIAVYENEFKEMECKSKNKDGVDTKKFHK